MRVVPSLLLLGGLLAAASANAQATRIYTWKDANGVTQYTDTPPPPSAKSSTRDITNKDGNVAPAQEPVKVSENPQCTNARYNQQILSSNAPVQETGADGKPHALNDVDRANRKQLADAAVANFCKPATNGDGTSQ